MLGFVLMKGPDFSYFRIVMFIFPGYNLNGAFPRHFLFALPQSPNPRLPPVVFSERKDFCSLQVVAIRH